MCNSQYSSHQQNSNFVLSRKGPTQSSHFLTLAAKGKCIRRFSVTQLTSGFSGGNFALLIQPLLPAPAFLLPSFTWNIDVTLGRGVIDRPEEVCTRSLQLFGLRNHLQCKKLGTAKTYCLCELYLLIFTTLEIKTILKI